MIPKFSDLGSESKEEVQICSIKNFKVLPEASVRDANMTKLGDMGID